MQQYLTLDEAAQMLNISADDLREMAKKKTVRAFQDRGTWRFRLQDIEELARKRGLGSDAALPLADLKKPAPAKGDQLAADFSLDDDEVPIGKEKASHGPRSGKSSGKTKSPPPAKAGSDSDVRLVMDDPLPLNTQSGSSVPKPPRKSSLPPGGRKSKLEAIDSGVRLVGSDEESDSDVKLVHGKESGVNKRPKSPSDSDIRLQDLPSNNAKQKGGEANVITEEIDLDAEEARLAERNKNKPKGKGKGRGQTMVANSSLLPTESPFELSEPDLDIDAPAKSGKKKKSEVDSSSDFELIPFDASKSPVELGSGEIPILKGDEEVNLGSEVRGGRSGNSGINLQDPVDSGISLESGGSDEIAFDLSEHSGMTPRPSAAAPKPEDDSSSEFELSLDDSDEAGSSEFELSVDDSDESSSSEFELSLDASDESSELAASDAEPNSDSEFELTLDDDGGLSAEDEDGKDIFEETNFDVPALEDDSGSEAVALEDGDTDLEGSDFEISLDEDSSTGEEAGSEVVSLDEDEEADEDAATIARARKSGKKSKLGAAIEPGEEEEPELDVDLTSSAPKKGKKGKKVVVDDEEEAEAGEDADSDDEVERPARSSAAPAEWGALPAVLLLPTMMILFVVGLMGFELVRGMWGYHRPSAVGRPIIDTIARQIDDTLPK